MLKTFFLLTICLAMLCCSAFASSDQGLQDEFNWNLTVELGLKDRLCEATKVWISGKKEGISQMNDSFDLMKVNQMDLMQIHNLLDWKTHIKTLRNWKEEGKIKYIGITHYHDGAYAEMEQIMKTEPLDFIQINFVNPFVVIRHIAAIFNAV